MKKLLPLLLLALFGSANLFAQFAATGTTSVQVTVAPEAAIQIDTAATTLTNTGIFDDFTGTTNFTYKIRTSTLGGTGAITLQVTSDFAPVGGPSAAAGTLSYACTAVAPATPCGGSQTASTAAATSVATFGASAQSLTAGTGGNSVSWALTDDPQYATGSYSSTVTFTISAT